MDLSCIILSGDLELYVLGLLPKDEADKVEQLAIIFPEVQAEIDRIAATWEALSVAASQPPSSSVKDRLMENLRNLKREEDPVQKMHPAPEDEENTLATPVVPLSPKSSRNLFLMAASVVGLIISIGIIIYLTNSNNQKNQSLAGLQQQVDTLRRRVDAQQQDIAGYSKTVDMMQSEDFRKINLKNVPGKPQALAQVFWNPQTHEVYITDVSLPEAPPDKQYQLWALIDGKPVDAGMLNNVKKQAQKMKTFEKADAFAITLENKGGSPTPTMEAMYVMGSV